MGEKLEGLIGVVGFLFFLSMAVVQIGAGYIGLDDSFGTGWAVAAVVLAFMFKFTLPLVVGTYLCATEILGWHWALGALVAMPGLLFMIPSLLVSALTSFKEKQ